MNIEEDIFKKWEIDKTKIIKYGFTKERNIYKYSKLILEDKFRIDVEIKNNKVLGKIIEMVFNEEYNNYRIESIKGEFVSKVRNEFINVLIDIRDNCFIKKPFIYSQTNRIVNLIKEKYGDNPEFLWGDFDGTGVLRNSKNKKWYAIIMNIVKNKIDIGEEIVEIINVKLDPNLINELIKRDGFYRAYHMNKKYWITLILNDTINDNEIMDLIDCSYRFTIINNK